MSRFFTDKGNIKNTEIFITDAADVKHLSKVLRHRIGDIIEISDGECFEYTGEITEIGQDIVKLKILSKGGFVREPETRVTLYQGLPKQGKMEVIVQKCTELGAAAVVPVFTDRTVVVDKGGFGKKTDRWQRVADEAVKQCRRGIIPEVRSAVKFKDLPQLMEENDLNLFCYEDEAGTTIKDVLRGLSGDVRTSNLKIGLIIGPEGGFSEEEYRLITGAGAKSVSLGKTILRAETAPIAALAMIMYELEQ